MKIDPKFISESMTDDAELSSLDLSINPTNYSSKFYIKLISSFEV